MEAIKYSETEQFRHIIEKVKRTEQFEGLTESNEPIYDETVKLPTIKFTGSVKLDGTCGGIMYDTGNIYPQSRSIMLGYHSDNHGFYKFIKGTDDLFYTLFWDIKNYYGDLCKGRVMIYGEFVGHGIQKGTGISLLPKSFFIFGIKLEKECEPYMSGEEYNSDKWFWATVEDINKIIPITWSKDYNLANIYSIYHFKTYSVIIDFNNPDIVKEEIDKYVKQVDDRCPVASSFLPKTEGLVGEGIVWKGYYKGKELKFKTKGIKHIQHFMKEPKPLTEEELVKLSIEEKCIDEVFSIDRCNQALTDIFGVDFEKNIDIKRIGDYFRWVNRDTLKEEYDILNKYNIDFKTIQKRLQTKSKTYFMAVVQS